MNNSTPTLPDIALGSGRVSHARLAPIHHSFSYQSAMVWINIQKLELIDSISPWWSSNRFNLVSLHRNDYLPGPLPLYEQVVELIKQKTGQAFSGSVYLLANLRSWGHCYNPVVFYVCIVNNQLRHLISEVHNTPWGERHCYVHSLNPDGEKPALGSTHVGDTIIAKEFHVSPFFAMELDYRWRYKISAQQFLMSMDLLKQKTPIFNATLNLKFETITAKSARAIALQLPLRSALTLLRIYWQALKLYLKRVPVFSHPG